jgi:hypothetical protein
MSLSMYQASIPAFVQMLNNIAAILDKALRGSRVSKCRNTTILRRRLQISRRGSLRQ